MLPSESFSRSKMEPASCWSASSGKAADSVDEAVEAVEAVGSMFLIFQFRRGLQFLQNFAVDGVAADGRQKDGIEHFRVEKVGCARTPLSVRGAGALRRRRFLLPFVRRERQGSGEEKSSLESEMFLALIRVVCNPVGCKEERRDLIAHWS